MTAGWLSRGCSKLHRLPNASRKVLAVSSWMIDVVVQDVLVSRRTKMVCVQRLRTAAA